MKKRFLLFLLLSCWQLTGHAANLVEVYRQALCNDPVYQAAIAQRNAVKTGVPLSIASILPHALFTMNPAVTRSGIAGSMLGGTNTFPFLPRNNTERTYTMRLTVTQTIFDFAKFYKIAGEVANAKGADATLNAALQNLMVRVANAYFDILKDEDDLAYADASKRAFKEQYDQMREQFKVGLKTTTDVYTAQASYESALATYIAAETKLANDRENLRVLTGVYYAHLSPLSEDFPLLKPNDHIEVWVNRALTQNWSIKASQYAVETAKQTIKQKMSGHFPTLEAQGMMDRIFDQNVNGYRAVLNRDGPGVQTDRQVGLNIVLPISEGGAVLAQTSQATYNYEIAQQQLEENIRQTINKTRQSYMNLIAGVSKITADKAAVKSAISSVRGIEESYRVGAETLVDVLIQQQKVYQTQTTYAQDRYAFIKNIFLLKQAAGTLSFEDLHAINNWLDTEPVKRVLQKKMHTKHLTSKQKNKSTAS